MRTRRLSDLKPLKPLWLRMTAIPLAVLLIGAGVSKGLDPGALAIVLNLSGIADWVVYPVVWVLPSVEIVFGLSLLFGWWSRSLITCVGALLVFFIGFLLFLDKVQPHVSCACFGAAIDDMAGTTPL